ncbi:MAG: hypothetical protein ABIC91_00085 [Nanoarchaeota archaeon]|nr:hypothetical protein [Nanoarchaeota archaeon]MBU1029611.1 hypothetical protein [Nanoarchaeota archaeon]MBU1850236.1 hypothetical protein [Nanoarchaeota archaeon]
MAVNKGINEDMKKNMKKSAKKGMIYTTVVLLFLTVLITVFYAYEGYKYGDRQDSIETRIKTMNEFIEDVHKDSLRAAYIAGFRTLIALEEHVSSTGEFLTDTNQYFRKAFYNGTIEGSTPEILYQSSFSTYLSRVNEKSGNIDVKINITVIEVNLYQSDPWNVRVDLLTNFSVIDKRGLAEWNYEKNLSTTIPIISLKDPLYSVETLGRVQSFIIPTNITEFVVNNDTDNLKEHIENGYYKTSTEAPNFLMRFEGDLSSNENGIESIVDISLLEKQEDIVIDYDRSVIDYVYFGTQATNNKCNIEDMPSWFKIDEEHINDYEINELTYIDCT